MLSPDEENACILMGRPHTLNKRLVYFGLTACPDCSDASRRSASVMAPVPGQQYFDLGQSGRLRVANAGEAVWSFYSSGYGGY
jgi:hypothetical protein